MRRETSTQQQVRRARVVLAAAGGANNEQIGREVGVTEDTARTWRRRWAGQAAALLAAEAEGDDGALAASIGGVLADAPRSGAPARFTPEQLCRIMALACEPPGDAGRPIGQWTPRELAAEAVKRRIVERISARTVGRFLVSGGAIKPHRSRYWLTPRERDPRRWPRRSKRCAPRTLRRRRSSRGVGTWSAPMR